MTHDDFCKAFRAHDGETPRKTALAFDGYELHFENGDVYRHEEVLKSNRTPSSWSGSFFVDDFVYTNTWNGEQIETP